MFHDDFNEKKGHHHWIPIFYHNPSSATSSSSTAKYSLESSPCLSSAMNIKVPVASHKEIGNNSDNGWTQGGFHSHAGSPIAGSKCLVYFMENAILRNGWLLGVALWLRKPHVKCCDCCETMWNHVKPLRARIFPTFRASWICACSTRRSSLPRFPVTQPDQACWQSWKPGNRRLETSLDHQAEHHRR